MQSILDSEELGQLAEKKLNNGAEAYRYAQKVTNDILFEHYGGTIKFPIDIREILKDFEIELYEMELNTDTGFRLEKVNGFLWEKLNGKMAINIDYHDSELVKRYVIAHELSHYLLRYAEDKKGTENFLESYNCVDPLFPKEWDELLADIMAAFFLFPPLHVLEHLEQYAGFLKEKNQYPMDAFEWLRVLGQCAAVSTYFTIISYQHLKFYMCYWYNDSKDKGKIDPLIEKYKRFFK